MAANVVEVVVKASNMTAAGFDAAKAGADEAAGSMDALAAANDRVTEASIRYSQAQGALLDAQLRLSGVEQDDSATEAQVAAARDKVTAATLKQADAQIALLNAEAKQDEAAAGAADASVAADGKVAAGAAAAGDAQKKAGDAAVASGAKADEAGGLMAGLGGKMKMAGLGIAVGMGLAVKSAADFQKQTTTLVTSAGESASQLGTLQQGILSLSSQTATSAEELSKGLYTISSSGITGASGLNVLKAAAEGAKAEGADLGEVTNALTSGINAYGMNVKTSAAATRSSTSMMNQMLATVSAGKMTFQELAGSLSAVLPIAAASGISYAQVGGALSTMTSMGVSAQQGTQDLAFTIRGLKNPTSVATNEMALFGVKSTDVSQQLGRRGLTGTIGMLSDAVTSRMGKSGEVIVNAMNQSKSAAADAQEMLGKLPAGVQKVARSYLDGSISTKQWTNDLKAMPPLQANLAKEWGNVANKSHSFNDLLKSGSPAAQTYAAAMSKMLGGATGLNVGLMLTGSHAATFNRNVKAIAASANGSSGQVAGFSEVTKETSFQLAKAGDSVKAMGTSLGLALLPSVNAVLAPLASFFSMLATHKAAAIAFAVVVGGVLAGAIGTKAVHALRDFKEAMKSAFDGIEAAGRKVAGMFAGQASASTAAAATQEGDAAAVAAADDGAAAESSGSWLGSFASRIAAGAVWVAQGIAKLAVIVASNVAGAATTAAAWVAANAVMLLGIGAVVAVIVVAVVEIIKHWRSIVAGVEKVWKDIESFVTRVVKDIVSWVKSHWMLLVAILTGPVGLAVAYVVTHFSQLKADVTRIVDDVIGWIRSHWQLLVAIFLSPLALVVIEVIRHFGQIRSGAEALVSDVVRFFGQLPGKIIAALGDLGSLLFSSGEKVIQGLINGVTSMVGAVGNAIGGIVSDIKSFLPFSPAKKGPLSGAGAPENSGRSIARLLASGITSGAGDVSGAMRRLAGAATGPGVTPAGVAGATGAAGQPQVIRLEFADGGGDLLVRWLRQVIRTEGGGDVQAYLGHS